MSPELEAALERARRWEETATDAEKKAMRRAQCESWCRGEMGPTDGCGTTYLPEAARQIGEQPCS